MFESRKEEETATPTAWGHGYDLPYLPPKKVVALLCRFNVHSISNIDSVKQTFDLDMQMEAFLPLGGKDMGEDVDKFYPDDEQRDEPGFCFNGMKDGKVEGITISELLADPGLWAPRLHLKNVKTLLQPVETWSGKADGGVYYKYRINATMFSQFSLRDFPFDKQGIHVMVSSDYPLPNEKDKMDAELKEGRGALLLLPRKAKSYLQRLQRDARDCWSIHSEIVYSYVGTSYESASLSHETYPMLEFTMFIKRKPQYFLWNIMLPMLVLATFALSSYTANTDHVDRIGNVLTLVLTTVAYKIVIGNMLPDISYLTWLDKFVLSCLAFLCVVMGDILSKSFYFHRDAEVEVAEFPVWQSVLWGVGLFSFLLHLLFAVLPWRSCLAWVEDGKRYEFIGRKGESEVFSGRNYLGRLLYLCPREWQASQKWHGWPNFNDRLMKKFTDQTRNYYTLHQTKLDDGTRQDLTSYDSGAITIQYSPGAQGGSSVSQSKVRESVTSV